MAYKAYAGIGSRETPNHVMSRMSELAFTLASYKYTLRSGAADGADTAFEVGADRFDLNKEIFIPWEGFNNRYSTEPGVYKPAFNYDIVFDYHPRPETLTSGAQKLMSRNSYQVLGRDLESPVAFVVCYTKDGKASGGTGQAIRIAEDYRIPVFNLYFDDAEQKLWKFIKK